MNVTDMTGRKLKVGQFIDVVMLGTFRAQVLDIKDTAIILSPKQAIPPHIVVGMTLTPFVRQDGKVPDCYIVAEADPKDPVTAAHEDKTRNIKLV